MIAYHDHDFDFDSWALQVSSTFSLPPLQQDDEKYDSYCDIKASADKSLHILSSKGIEVGFENIVKIDVNQLEFDSKYDKEQKYWEGFFRIHSTGQFFKARKYISCEFFTYLRSDTVKQVLEVGSGFGCSMYPLLEQFSFDYVATDYSQTALKILMSNPNYGKFCNRIKNFQWDLCKQYNIDFDCNPQVILMIFVLSAIHPNEHIQCLQNLLSIAKDSELVILFRDYGIHDMTMYRHKYRFATHLFRRTDGTIAYYFDMDYLRQLCTTVGLDVIEMHYATVINKNRKDNSEMKRVFLHGVFKKKIHNQSSSIQTLS